VAAAAEQLSTQAQYTVFDLVGSTQAWNTEWPHKHISPYEALPLVAAAAEQLSTQAQYTVFDLVGFHTRMDTPFQQALARQAPPKRETLSMMLMRVMPMVIMVGVMMMMTMMTMMMMMMMMTMTMTMMMMMMTTCPYRCQVSRMCAISAGDIGASIPQAEAIADALSERNRNGLHIRLQ
jgi:hypothetical protein